jgi:hypothetical protein
MPITNDAVKENPATITAAGLRARRLLRVLP